MNPLKTAAASLIAFALDVAESVGTAVVEFIGTRVDAALWDEPADDEDCDPRPGGLAAHLARTIPSDTPIAEAALLAVYGEYLDDWAAEVDALADVELAELMGGES